MKIRLGDKESMIIIREGGKYQSVVPRQSKHESLCETSEIAFMLIYALSDDECMRTIKRRWNERLNEVRSPN